MLLCAGMQFNVKSKYSAYGAYECVVLLPLLPLAVVGSPAVGPWPL